MKRDFGSKADNEIAAPFSFTEERREQNGEERRGRKKFLCGILVHFGPFFSFCFPLRDFRWEQKQESNFQWLLAYECDFERHLERVPRKHFKDVWEISIRAGSMTTRQLQLVCINRLIKNKRASSY